MALVQGKQTLLGGEDGDRECKDKMMAFSGGTGGKQRMGKVRQVCTEKYRNSGSCQHSKAREKSFYTELRLERGEVCLPVQTFMLHDRMKTAIHHRNCVKTLQDSLGGFSAFFFNILTFRIWKEGLLLWLGKSGNGDENYFKNMKFDLLA